ncbi:MAG: hypothetical protein AUH39_03380 [Chloroflexi bacterium 13_1_40CM_67_9]|nr:MAG: hypothetical protein AUH39_03380 [Chloroflexi bacterium 13_1_40CM_67_9]
MLRRELLGGALGDETTLVQDADAVGEPRRLIEVVRRQDDRRVVLVAQIADERLNLPLAPNVKASGGLVEEQQHRRREERARDRDLLLHSARERLERLLHAGVLDAEPAEDRNDLRA